MRIRTHVQADQALCFVVLCGGTCVGLWRRWPRCGIGVCPPAAPGVSGEPSVYHCDSASTLLKNTISSPTFLNTTPFRRMFYGTIFRSKHRNTDHLHGTCSLSPPPRQAGAAPGRRVRAGKASRSCRAHRWSCRFRALPVRGTAHPSRAPVIREATLGITANTGNPRLAASDQPDTTGRS